MPGSALSRSLPAAALLAALSLTACGGGDLLDNGRFEGHTYVHDGLRLRLPFPDTWQISPPEAIARMNDTGRKILSGGDPTGGAYGDQGAPSRTLFVVHRHLPGSVPGVNPSLVGAMENIAARPQIQSGADYLQMVQSFLARGGTPMTFEPISNDASLAGQPFAVMGATIQPEPGQRIGQVYHARRVEDFVFTVVATFGTESQWNELEAVLHGMIMER
jgi:hypothetical protein